MLKGKNAIITGANRGIGYATLELFAKRVAISGPALESLIQNLSSK